MPEIIANASDSPIIITSRSTHIDACQDAFKQAGDGAFKLTKAHPPRMIVFSDGKKILIQSGEWSVGLAESNDNHIELSGHADSNVIEVKVKKGSASPTGDHTQLDHPTSYLHTHVNHGNAPQTGGPGCLILFWG